MRLLKVRRNKKNTLVTIEKDNMIEEKVESLVNCMTERYKQ